MAFDVGQLIDAVIDGSPEPLDFEQGAHDHRTWHGEHSTSLSLARALSLGCVAGWEATGADTVEIWDPTIGGAGAASLLAKALSSVGVQAAVRGQDVNEETVQVARARLDHVHTAQVTLGDSLSSPASFGASRADLVLVDPPWGLNWTGAEKAVRERNAAGEFHLGLPPRGDSTWLFLSLALERMKSPDEGGGRVAALVYKRLLSSTSPRERDIRQRLLEGGLLESVVRLPEALAPNTAIPLYLMTFTNQPKQRHTGRARVMDLRTGFVQVGSQRTMTRSALAEIANNLRVWKPSQRSRVVTYDDFTRRTAKVGRTSKDGKSTEWLTTTYGNIEISQSYLRGRYGDEADVSRRGEVTESVDLDPGHFFGDDLRDITREARAHGWASAPLVGLLGAPARSVTAGQELAPSESTIWVPTFQGGRVSTQPPDLHDRQRAIELDIDDALVRPDFVAAWLNTDSGTTSRLRAYAAASASTFSHGVRSDPSSLMRWAEELFVPVPGMGVQETLASADFQLRAYSAEIDRRRGLIWDDPDSAESAVISLTDSFDDSLEKWLEQLPSPIATALWTALTSGSPGGRQLALVHAWEAIATFHATMLLSGSRTDAVRSGEIERSIGSTLRANNMSINRATFGTWVVIIEKLASEIRTTIGRDDPDDVARLRRSFAGMTTATIGRLVSKELVALLNEMNQKRNRWHGHSGHVSDADFDQQVDALTADLVNLRGLLADAWSKAPLVRAGQVRVRAGRMHQSVEMVMGTRTPFRRETILVGEPMEDGELYLAPDGVETPLRLSRFIRLSAAPSGSQFTSYFYDRTESDGVRFVSYQHATHNEIHGDLDEYQHEFGSLVGD